MIESMAGKSASLHGLCLDATPFTFSEDTPAIDYYGHLLVKGWYVNLYHSSYHACCLLISQLVSITMAMNVFTVELQGESLKLKYSLALCITKGSDIWSQTNFR